LWVKVKRPGEEEVVKEQQETRREGIGSDVKGAEERE